jgi:hypothetical protein
VEYARRTVVDGDSELPEYERTQGHQLPPLPRDGEESTCVAPELKYSNHCQSSTRK